MLGFVASALLASSALASSETFNYTGTAVTWTVPAGVTTATFDLYGAAGGSYAIGSPGGVGGKGGHVQASVDLTPGDTLNLRVGGQGEDAFVAPSPFVGTLTAEGGFNGGGDNSIGCSSDCGGLNMGGAGGGASDVRTGGDGIADRLLVAGGGGGAGPGGDPDQFGDGGGSDTAAPSVTTTFPSAAAGPRASIPNEGPETCSGGGAGTTQGPGAAGSGNGNCVPGSAGDGASGGSGLFGMGAGGGGYFGGGAGAFNALGGSPASGGGGGSDFPDLADLPAGVGALTVEHGVRTGNGLITISYTANSTAAPGKDPKCKKLRKKLKRQQQGLAKASTEAKRSMVQVNIEDTQKRLKKLGC